MFGEKPLGKVPSTDEKALPGRTVEVSLPEIIPHSQKHFVRLRFKVDRIDGDKAHTKFYGCSIAREQMFRIIRKRTQKVELINEIKTADGWQLQLTTVVVLNRRANTTTGTRVRNEMDAWLREFGSKTSLDELVKSVTAGSAQKTLKRMCSKIYPVRFSEITKIEVLKQGKG